MFGTLYLIAAYAGTIEMKAATMAKTITSGKNENTRSSREVPNEYTDPNESKRDLGRVTTTAATSPIYTVSASSKRQEDCISVMAAQNDVGESYGEWLSRRTRLQDRLYASVATK